MPKLKTNSSAKKRFKITAGGNVKHKPAGKRHGMTKKTKKQIRQLRKSSILSKSNVENICKKLMPYN